MKVLRGMVLAVTSLCLLAVVGGPASAQPSMIGLYLDQDRTGWCANGIGVYQIEMWVYVIIEGDGILGYGFDLDIPPNVDYVTGYANPLEIPEYCDPNVPCPGIDGALSKCLTGWVWVRRMIFNVTSPEPAVIQLTGHPESGLIGLVNCNNVPFYPTVLTRIYVNYDPASPECTSTVPTHDATWGAIRALYAKD